MDGLENVCTYIGMPGIYRQKFATKYEQKPTKNRKWFNNQCTGRNSPSTVCSTRGLRKKKSDTTFTPHSKSLFGENKCGGKTFFFLGDPPGVTRIWVRVDTRMLAVWILFSLLKGAA